MSNFIKEIQTTSKLCPKIYSYAELGSTNNLAHQLIEKEGQIGFAIVTETQTAGQGQGGRFWESPRGGLWISLAIKPLINLRFLGMVPILSGVGIANALESFDIEVMLKWPNDLLIHRTLKKVGGILVEGKVTQLSLDYLIVGVGLNINNTLEQFSLPLQEKITTIFEEFQKKIDLNDLMQKIILEVERLFDNIRSHGVHSILAEWKQKKNILGMNIKVQSPEGEYQGRAINISPFGQLVIELPDSNKVLISTGTVTLLKK